MFQTLKNSWKIPELRNKLLFTLLIILIYRLGSAIPVPFVDASALSGSIWNNPYLFGISMMVSGGALSQATMFALGVSPYITASIVMQLLTVAIPALERMAKEEDGKKKINVITRIVTIVLAIITAFGYSQSIQIVDKVRSPVFAYFVIIACFCAGAALVMWLAEKINEHGIGNGISIILFANILASLPQMVTTVWEIWVMGGVGKFNVGGLIAAIGFLIALLALTVLCVWFTNSERRIPIQYAKRVVGRKMYGGQGTNLPIKMNMAGVMPIIFAQSIVTLPALILSMFQGINTDSGFGWFIQKFFTPTQGAWPYVILYLVLLVAFSYFYIMISFNPVEVANNIRNNGGAIPGIRPGRPTSDFIKKILNRITLIGAGFLTVIAILPMILGMAVEEFAIIAFSGNSLLIVVGVALETVRDLEAQITMRNYKGFLD